MSYFVVGGVSEVVDVEIVDFGCEYVGVVYGVLRDFGVCDFEVERFVEFGVFDGDVDFGVFWFFEVVDCFVCCYFVCWFIFDGGDDVVGVYVEVESWCVGNWCDDG